MLINYHIYFLKAPVFILIAYCANSRMEMNLAPLNKEHLNYHLYAYTTLAYNYIYSYNGISLSFAHRDLNSSIDIRPKTIASFMSDSN